jgi:hypothetical protein
MCIRENIFDGGSWMKWFRISQNGEFCIRGDRLCVRIVWSWLTAYGRDPKRTKETIVFLQVSFFKRTARKTKTTNF